MARFEILKHLPPYGPMYVPIPGGDSHFGGEGFIVCFYKKDGSNWIANFAPGIGPLYKIIDMPEQDRTFVIAGSTGYLISIEQAKSFATINRISEVYEDNHGRFICCDSWFVYFFDGMNGQFSKSEKLSFDGIKDLKIEGHSITGKSYEISSNDSTWTDFVIDTMTGKVTGGAWNAFLERNPHLEVGPDGLMRDKRISIIKPW